VMGAVKAHRIQPDYRINGSFSLDTL
jgi:hypothetical protein